MPTQMEENKATRILIVDDDAGQRSLLHSFLKIQGFQTTPVASGEEALHMLRERPFELMICDVRMPGISGLETMRRARAANSSLPILLVTAYADIREAVSAMRDGALNYLSKPIDLDELLASVRHAVGLSKQAPMKFEDKQLPRGVIAASPAMQALFRDASLVAQSDSRVLISGESGAGKQILAEVIHQWGARSGQPFVRVDCAAPDVEGELFGTSATAQPQGLFQQASGGTILLDQIAELPPSTQAKILRCMDEAAQPGSAGMPRVIASASASLDEQVRGGRFREELFYRLNVVELHVPPLRERREDILPLAAHFVDEITAGRAKLSPAASDILDRYQWPGNVRELRNAIERAALLSRGEVILPEHLPSRVQSAAAEGSSVGISAQPLEELEDQAILAALRKHGFNRSEAARVLGISRRGLLYKLQHLRDRGYKVDPD